MKKLDHTPGPWKVVSSGRKYHWPIIEIGKVEVIINTEKHCEANARLIAHAPDMLDDMIWFVKRCRAGEVRSVKTQARFIERIESATGKTIEEILK